jgi:carbamate kinase
VEDQISRIVVALGGNAIVQAGQRGTAEEQEASVARSCAHIATMLDAGYDVVLTHGNGPQVGNLLIKNELARDIVPPMPLDWCVAQTQATVGYMIQQSLGCELARRGSSRPIVTMITRTEVRRDDPAWRLPTKPIGLYQPEQSAREIAASTGQTWAPQGERGWRRVVPSPDPVAIVDRGAILAMIETGVLVVACGGGGVPVVRNEDGSFDGVEAVIDKDLGAALLAREVGASTLLILTDVEHAIVGYGSPRAEPLREISAARLRAYQAEGHFASGSMGPKIEAALRFVEAGAGRRAIISALDVAVDALAGRTGTQVRSGK